MQHSGTNPSDSSEPTRHVRLRLPDSLYRELRHLVVDAGRDASMSDLIAGFIERGIRERQGR